MADSLLEKQPPITKAQTHKVLSTSVFQHYVELFEQEAHLILLYHKNRTYLNTFVHFGHIDICVTQEDINETHNLYATTVYNSHTALMELYQVLYNIRLIARGAKQL